MLSHAFKITCGNLLGKAYLHMCLRGGLKIQQNSSWEILHFCETINQLW